MEDWRRLTLMEFLCWNHLDWNGHVTRNDSKAEGMVKTIEVILNPYTKYCSSISWVACLKERLFLCVEFDSSIWNDENYCAKARMGDSSTQTVLLKVWEWLVEYCFLPQTWFGCQSLENGSAVLFSRHCWVSEFAKETLDRRSARLKVFKGKFCEKTYFAILEHFFLA